jgi:hypothetical protein
MQVLACEPRRGHDHACTRRAVEAAVNSGLGVVVGIAWQYARGILPYPDLRRRIGFADRRPRLSR